MAPLYKVPFRDADTIVQRAAVEKGPSSVPALSSLAEGTTEDMKRSDRFRFNGSAETSLQAPSLVRTC